MKQIVPFLRSGNYQFRKRVPRRYASVEPQPIVQLSLHTDSLEVARRKAPEVWSQMIDAWEAKLDGLDTEGAARLAAAKNLAARRGFRFLHVEDVARLPIQDILNRLDMVPDSPRKADLPIIEAALGTADRPKVTVSKALDAFYEVTEERLVGKNEDQVRKHRNPREKAISAFVEVVGDKALSDITTRDMFEFRKHLVERVKTGEIKAGSANKDITHLLGVFGPVAQALDIPLGYSRDGLRLKVTAGEEDETRPPFSEDWIKDKILAPGALSKLNTDARLIVLGMINTGYRPSEAAGLLPEEIVLTANIPHIIIRPNVNRGLKNRQSKRTLPLTGVSLEAFREASNGFPRYAEKSATLSATVNKFLSSNGLLETPDHSLYSFRHAIEDRMLRAGIDERIRMDVLGHKIRRQRYGDGGGIEYVHEQLLKVAI